MKNKNKIKTKNGIVWPKFASLCMKIVLIFVPIIVCFALLAFANKKWRTQNVLCVNRIAFMARFGYVVECLSMLIRFGLNGRNFDAIENMKK